MPNYLQNMMEQADKPTKRQMQYAANLAALGDIALPEGMTKTEIGEFIEWAENEFYDFIKDARAEMFAFTALND